MAAGKHQRGVMMIALLSVMVLGGAWYVTSALGRAASMNAERERQTGVALAAAKQALLGYVAASAASSTELYPGRLPCPEVRSQVGTANEGYAGPFAGIACDSVGRLPWRTLGIDQLRDGYGEPLWLAVPTGTWAWANLNDALTINPASANQLQFDGTPAAAVAVIIAPGPPIAKSGTPPSGCANVNQQVATRNSALAVANFLECGNATGSYRAAPTTEQANVPRGEQGWSNDRAVTITAREVMDAISAAVADRVQRQVAPALNEWLSTDSLAWGRSFMPYAASFGTTPATNGLCGTASATEGLLPLARLASGCVAWTSGSVTVVTGTLGAPSCAPTGSAMRCTFTGLGAGVLGVFRADVSVTGAQVAQAFRDPIASADVTVVPGATVSNFTLSLDGAGVATASFRISTNLLWSVGSYTVTIGNPPEAGIFTDSRMTWFINNEWNRYTYYALSPAARIAPGSTTCPAAGGADCLVLSGLPAANGLANDKKFVLAILGNAVTTAGGYAQTQPSANYLDYLESHTAGTSSFTLSTVSASFNDRLAACPFQHTATTGVVTLC